MAADETISIIKIDTSPASLSIKDLKNNISLLKKDLDDLEIGSEEYQSTLNELKTNQNALKDAMYATSASMNDVIDSATGASESYNSLVHRMAALKEELRNVDVSTEAGNKRFKELAGQVNDINNKLKALDAAQGNFQRNVGMYTDKIAQMGNAFKMTAGSAGAMINPIAGATAGLKAMSATPVVAILGLLANVINAVVRELKSSEDNMNAARMEMSAFSGVATLFKNLMQTLGTAVGFVVKQINNLALKVFPKLRDAAEKQNAITQAQIALSYKQREATEKNADAELEIAKLREKAVDKEKYSATERIAFLEEANNLELAISRRNKEIAEQEYEIALEKSKLSKNSKEENDALAEAYAKRVRAETEYYKKARENTASLVKAKREERKAMEEVRKANIDIQIKQHQESKEYWEQYAESIERYSDEYFQAQEFALTEWARMEKDIIWRDVEDKDEAAQAMLKIDNELLHKRLALAEQYGDEMVMRETDSIIARLNTLTKGSMKYIATEEELAKWEMNSIISKGRLATETQEQFEARRDAAAQIYYEKRMERLKAEIDMFRIYGESIGSIFASIADVYEADDALAEKNAEKIKALRIAEATINTISGAVGAFMGITKDTGGWGIAQATLQAASVLAAGYAQIAKIKATKVSSSGTSTTSSSASVTPPMVSANVQNVRNLTSASEEERLNAMAGDQRVVLVMSDLEVAQGQSRVQTQESSF